MVVSTVEASSSCADETIGDFCALASVTAANSACPLPCTAFGSDGDRSLVAAVMVAGTSAAVRWANTSAPLVCSLAIAGATESGVSAAAGPAGVETGGKLAWNWAENGVSLASLMPTGRPVGAGAGAL